MREVGYVFPSNQMVLGHTEPHVQVYYRHRRTRGLIPTAISQIHHIFTSSPAGHFLGFKVSQSPHARNMKIFYVTAAPLLASLLLLTSASLPQAQNVGPETVSAQRPSAAHGWSWPLNPQPNVFSPFDPPAQRWLAGHRGADLAARVGNTVLAPAGGIVSYAGIVVDRPVLVIDHGSGLKSSFEPVRTDLVPGSIVSAREEIGIMSIGAHCSNRCLHWGLRLDGQYIDPLLTIRDDRPSILLPLRSGPH